MADGPIDDTRQLLTASDANWDLEFTQSGDQRRQDLLDGTVLRLHELSGDEQLLYIESTVNVHSTDFDFVVTAFTPRLLILVKGDGSGEYVRIVETWVESRMEVARVSITSIHADQGAPVWVHVVVDLMGGRSFEVGGESRNTSASAGTVTVLRTSVDALRRRND